ncbi:hypothetical protein BRC62_03700 [Halobacteriales archaeon QH_10_67_13]|nr:MAG: hypothetical protein BRC62_03700 [Halobacteriales archaeon QH_10_67_13]
MPESLEVRVGREAVHGLDAPATFAAEESFSIQIRNYGRPVHVHLHPDETLAQATSVEGGNHYLEAEDSLTVPVTVEAELDPSDRRSGTLRLVAGYGAAETEIEIELRSPAASSVTVDERLAEPRSTKSGSGSRVLDRPTGPVLALGGLAVVVAVLSAAIVRTPAVIAGAAAVVVGVAVAVAFLRQDKRD